MLFGYFATYVQKSASSSAQEVFFFLQVPMERNLEVANFPMVQICFYIFEKICYYYGNPRANHASHYTFRLWRLWCWRSRTSRKRWPWLSCWNWYVCVILKKDILLLNVKNWKYNKISLMFLQVWVLEASLLHKLKQPNMVDHSIHSPRQYLH